MSIEEDRWLSRIFGHSVFRIGIDPSREANDSRGDLYTSVAAHFKAQARAMYYAKVPTDQIDLVRRLGALGLYVVEVNVTFARAPDGRVDAAPPASMTVCPIGELGASRQGEVLELAATCFKYSRFHLDPLVPTSIANQVKHDWVLSYLQKERGEELLVAAVEGRPVGFLAVLAAEEWGKRIRVIDLIGVGGTFQNRGVAKALVGAFIDRSRYQCEELRVGTQVANTASMRLYEQCGFSVVRSAYVMHMHVRQGS